MFADADRVAALLVFTTKSTTNNLVGTELDGRPFSFPENVFHDFKDGKIIEVHSLVDNDTIRAHERTPCIQYFHNIVHVYTGFSIKTCCY